MAKRFFSTEPATELHELPLPNIPTLKVPEASPGQQDRPSAGDGHLGLPIWVCGTLTMVSAIGLRRPGASCRADRQPAHGHDLKYVSTCSRLALAAPVALPQHFRLKCRSHIFAGLHRSFSRGERHSAVSSYAHYGSFRHTRLTAVQLLTAAIGAFIYRAYDASICSRHHLSLDPAFHPHPDADNGMGLAAQYDPYRAAPLKDC